MSNRNKFILQPYQGSSSRITCPGCGQNSEFSKYIDIENIIQLPDFVGKCNRIINCGYHYTPKQYFSQHNNNPPKRGVELCVKDPLQKQNIEVSYIDPQVMQNRMSDSIYPNNFLNGIRRLFGAEITFEIIKKYNIGTSIHWEGATIFWQVDIHGKVRQAKVIPYHVGTLKRVKKEEVALKYDYKTQSYIKDSGTDKVWFAGKFILKNYNAHFEQCFFGEHILANTPISTPVAIVESEKTAIISSIILPQFVWLATGGLNGCKWLEPNVNHVLKGRTITLFPDNDAFDKWDKKATILAKIAQCTVKCSDYVKKNFGEYNKCDLADLFLQNIDKEFGWVLTEQNGHPVFWDYDKAKQEHSKSNFTIHTPQSLGLKEATTPPLTLEDLRKLRDDEQNSS